MYSKTYKAKKQCAGRFGNSAREAGGFQHTADRTWSKLYGIGRHLYLLCNMQLIFLIFIALAREIDPVLKFL